MWLRGFNRHNNIANLNKALGCLVGSHSWPCFKQKVLLETSKSLFQPKLFSDAAVRMSM